MKSNDGKNVPVKTKSLNSIEKKLRKNPVYIINYVQF